MDDKQAAAVLREIAFRGGITEPEACRRGADALEMLEWLRTQLIGDLWRTWLDDDLSRCEFLAFLEARFEEYRKGLTK